MDALALIRPPFTPHLHRFSASRRSRISSVFARSFPPPPSPSGDPDVQRKLVEIIRLETDKIRVCDYVEERSKFLQGIADGAIQESDRIASDALKGLDEASAKVRLKKTGKKRKKTNGYGSSNAYFLLSLSIVFIQPFPAS